MVQRLRVVGGQTMTDSGENIEHSYLNLGKIENLPGHGPDELEQRCRELGFDYFLVTGYERMVPGCGSAMPVTVQYYRA